MSIERRRRWPSRLWTGIVALSALLLGVSSLGWFVGRGSPGWSFTSPLNRRADNSSYFINTSEGELRFGRTWGADVRALAEKHGGLPVKGSAVTIELELASLVALTAHNDFLAGKDLVRSHIRATRLPAWYPVAVFALLPAWWVVVRAIGVIRQHLRHEAGTCARCGYDLRASPDRCPECGTNVEPVAPGLVAR